MLYDYAKHNEAVKRLLEKEKAGVPERVRMDISCNPRMILSDPALNTQQVTFEEYMNNPQLMLEIQCRFQEYRANSIFYDHIMGFENLPGVSAYGDFQNVFEASYFGCETAYHGINEPGTKVLLSEKTAARFTDRPFPPITSGMSGKALEYYAYFQEQKRKGFSA